MGPYRNYVVAKEFCGLKEKEFTNLGTFTNFFKMTKFVLIIHIMYLKFGFGRATQDAGIEIRRGAMDRPALNLVNLYENSYSDEFLEIYLDYFKMTTEEFNMVIDKWANKDLFQKLMANGSQITVGSLFNMKIVIVDYGMGNIHSLKGALTTLNHKSKVFVSNEHHIISQPIYYFYLVLGTSKPQ